MRSDFLLMTRHFYEKSWSLVLSELVSEEAIVFIIICCFCCCCCCCFLMSHFVLGLWNRRRFRKNKMFRIIRENLERSLFSQLFIALQAFLWVIQQTRQNNENTLLIISFLFLFLSIVYIFIGLAIICNLWRRSQ